MEGYESLENLVKREIDRLHIPPTIRGHSYLVYIVEQAALTPDRLTGITKDLYRETARQFHTNWNAVERSSRSAIALCWASDAGRKRLCTLAGCQLTERPSTSAFVRTVAMHIAARFSSDA